MPRVAEEFLLRQYPNSPYWYYRLKGQKNFQSTGRKTKAAAKKHAIEKYNDIKENGPRVLFKEYANVFFALDSPRQLQREALLQSTIEWRARMFRIHLKDYFAK